MARAAVLYVEDEEDDVFFMRSAFSKLGLGEVHAVQDGKAAMDYLSHHSTNGQPPPVILLDINLPLISGFEVLQWIRQQQHLEGVAVVVFSSSGRAEDRRRAEQLGATDYVLKPASGQEFITLAQAVRERWLS